MLLMLLELPGGYWFQGKAPVHAFNPAELLSLMLYSSKEFPRLTPS